MHMEPIKPEEVLSPEIYKSEREEITRKIVSEKKKRRLVTKTFSFLFESRNTVLNQINEMVFIENVHDTKEIDRLIRVYSDQLPTETELSISMFIEFEDERQMVREIPKLAGVENSVYLTFDGHEVKGTPEEGRSTDVLESTLQYLKFKFSRTDYDKFAAARNVYIEARKEGYNEAAKIPSDLLEDLKSELKF